MENKKNIIPVTKSFIPPIELYKDIVQRAFVNEWLTNRGELVLELESKIKNYLSVDNILITNNGTIPLQIALKLLGKGGEVITTPFSYVATTAAIVWENCTPVFVDIHPEYLTIDESKIEAAITSKTTCILATHVFGNPCNVEVIEQIANKYDLKVIYDAAHCFGVKYKGRSIFEYGDISTCSFHATKIFHTGEGGAIFWNNEQLGQKIFQSHNFGHKDELSFYGLGINGKISEINAAMGLAVFPYLDEILNKRKFVVDFYSDNLNFDKLSRLLLRKDTVWNNSYYPVIFSSEKELIEIQKRLNAINVYPRRYFHPSLNQLPYIKGDKVKMIFSEEISSKILCLPLYIDINEDDLNMIVNLINNY